MAKTGTKQNRGGWLKDARVARNGETIGGGFFVFRRGDCTGRIRPSMWPFEYGSLHAAEIEAKRLAAEMPGYRFDVVSVAEVFVEPAIDTEAQIAA